jgi:phosphatidylglycerol---prolipoprotein diacylglyceryl transferase
MNPDFLVDFPGLGIKDLPVSRVAFQIFGLPIYWYGLLIAFALILCLLLAMRQAKANQLTADDVMDTFIAIIPLMIIFARLFYVVFQWEYYAKDWKLIFDTRHGGLAFYGGVIGGILAILLVTKIKKIKISILIDFLAVYVPLGQAIGRWGNFFNQEAFGTNTRLPWGMYSNGTEAFLKTVSGTDPTSPVHPTFLYEFIANILIFLILLRVRKHKKFPFQVMFWYLLLYGIVRFFVEGIRTDPLYIPGTELRISQVLSALMVIVSIIMLIVLNRHRQRLELAALLAGETPAVPDEEITDNEDEAVFIEIADQEAEQIAESKPEELASADSNPSASATTSLAAEPPPPTEATKPPDQPTSES